MKPMTVDEILAAEIPKGTYMRGMVILKNAFRESGNFSEPNVRDEEICVAFTALMELAKAGHSSLQECAMANLHLGEAREHQRILGIVAEMEKEFGGLGYPTEEKWNQPTLDELRRRIEGK